MLQVLILRFKVTSGPTDALSFGIRTEASNSGPEGAGPEDASCFLMQKSKRISKEDGMTEPLETYRYF